MVVARGQGRGKWGDDGQRAQSFGYARLISSALARWLSWLECCTVYQKVCGFDSLSGYTPGLRVQSQLLSLSLSLSLKSINISLGEN